MFKSSILVLFLIVSLLPNMDVNGQEKVEKIPLRNIQGSSIGSGSNSIESIREEAINNAKIRALKEAGITENISSYTDHYESQTREDYEELFASDIFSNIQGAVKNVEVIKEEKHFTKQGLPKVEVWINCTVLKYNTSKDRTFEFEVDGINPVYKHNDLFTYTIKPHKDGYLRGFVFTSEEAFQIFPNEYEESYLFQSGETYDLPREVDITLENRDKNKQSHRAVFVFLKEDIPYTGEVTYEEIFDWIFSIPIDQRNVKSFSFLVVRK